MTKRKTKQEESVDLMPVKPAKKILRKSHPNFPNKGGRKKGAAEILPGHREIFKNFQEQKYVNFAKAVRKTGRYSENVALRVNMIKNTVSWKMLMAEHIPEHKLAVRHAEILDKRDYRKELKYLPDGSVALDGEGKAIYEEVDDGPNTAAVTKGLEMAYKLHGSFKEQKEQPAGTVMYNLFYNPQVQEQMKTFETNIKQTMTNEIAKKNQKDLDDERYAEEQGQKRPDADTEG